MNIAKVYFIFRTPANGSMDREYGGSLWSESYAHALQVLNKRPDILVGGREGRPNSS